MYKPGGIIKAAVYNPQRPSLLWGGPLIVKKGLINKGPLYRNYI